MPQLGLAVWFGMFGKMEWLNESTFLLSTSHVDDDELSENLAH